MDASKSSISENIRLVEFLLHIVVCCHSEMSRYCHSNDDLRCVGDHGKKLPQQAGLWKVQTNAFSMIGESFTRLGASFPVDTWQSVVEVGCALFLSSFNVFLSGELRLLTLFFRF